MQSYTQILSCVSHSHSPSLIIISFLFFSLSFKTAQSEGSIRMDEGEELEVVETDQGDGWTRVRRINNEEEGFVPTSYLEIDVIANC